MADPLSVTAGVIAVVTFSFQAATSLHDVIKSYQNVPKYVRELREELEALNKVLVELQAMSMEARDAQEFATLELPLQRCGDSCREFEETLRNCAERGGGKGSRLRVVEWFKIRWMGGDINGFRDRLASYKSTISIAIVGINLKTTKASVQAFEQYKEMIKNTQDDLEDHLQDLDQRSNRGAQQNFYGDPSIDGAVLEKERSSAAKCLQICSEVFEFIEYRERAVSEMSASAPLFANSLSFDTRSSQELAQRTLQECSGRILSVTDQLAHRVRRLTEELQDTGAGAEESSTMNPSDKTQIRDQLESVRQCLEICEQAAEDAHKVRRNVMEDNVTEDDSHQILASTVNDLIFARRNKAGARSVQMIGQYSDETVQKIYAIRMPDSAEFSGPPKQQNLSRQNVGRTLGSSNPKMV